MAPSTKLEDKLEGIENYRAWKYKIGLILKENDLGKYIEKKLQNLMRLKLRRSTKRI